MSLTKYFHAFLQQYKGLEDTAAEALRSPKTKLPKISKKNLLQTKMQFLKTKKWYFVFAIYSTLPWFYILPFFKGHQEMQQIRNRAGEIKTIVLVKPGGSGKTILSPQYAHQEKAKLIWEINAELHAVIVEILVNMEARDGKLGSMGERGGAEKAKNLEVQKIHSGEKTHPSIKKQ